MATNISQKNGPAGLAGLPRSKGLCCMALLRYAHSASRPRPGAPRISAPAVGGPGSARPLDAGVAAPQQPAAQQPQPQQPAHNSAWYKQHFDLNLYHYLPWWLQPGPILVSGALFFAAALAIDNEEPTLKAAVIAAGPVVLYYALALFVLPSQFSKFAVSYLKKHPELEAQASQPGGSREEA